MQPPPENPACFIKFCALCGASAFDYDLSGSSRLLDLE